MKEKKYLLNRNNEKIYVETYIPNNIIETIVTGQFLLLNVGRVVLLLQVVIEW